MIANYSASQKMRSFLLWVSQCTADGEWSSNGLCQESQVTDTLYHTLDGTNQNLSLLFIADNPTFFEHLYLAFHGQKSKTPQPQKDITVITYTQN